MMFRAMIAAALASVALAAGPGSALAACSMTKVPVPVTMQGMRPMVVAKVDGHDVRFLLDSGAFFNGISARFAVEQKMRPAQGRIETGSRLIPNAQTGFSGVAGVDRVSPVVQADEFQFADTNFGRAAFMTLPLEEGGLLGQNFLKLADVEYDFRNRTFAMVLVKDCKTDVLAYWAKGPYSMLPLEHGADGYHTVATVLINGRKMRALFDTGAEGSFITRAAAARAGVKVTDPEVKEVGVTGGLDSRSVKTWLARFDSVKLDTEEIIKGQLMIGDTDADFFDILIGADFFLSHHVYVANSQSKIYFTHSGGPAFNAGPSPGDRPAIQAPRESKTVE